MKENMSDYFKKNSEGYSDPTAYNAVKNIEHEEELTHERMSKLFRIIRYICELSGFSIEGRIVLKDKSTGRIWR